MFLLCFSIADPEAFKNIKLAWKPELQHFRPEGHIILVGTKLDLRDDKEVIDSLQKKNLTPITTEQGLEMAKDIGAVKYMECSSLLQKGLNEIFEEGVRAVRTMPIPSREKKKCVLL